MNGACICQCMVDGYKNVRVNRERSVMEEFLISTCTCRTLEGELTLKLRPRTAAPSGPTCVVSFLTSASLVSPPRRPQQDYRSCQRRVSMCQGCSAAGLRQVSLVPL